MDIGSTLISNAKATHLAEPRQRPFHYTTVTAQTFARVSTSSSDAHLDAPTPESQTTFLEVIALVRVHLVRAFATSPPTLLDQRNGIDKCFEDNRVMSVGSGDHHRQRSAAAVYHKMAFCARFSAIRTDASSVRIRAGVIPLFAAGMFCASTAARLQSSWSASPRRSSRTSWSRCQTPASFQSRRRRQQVMPLPHPSSWGNMSQGMPLLSTKRTHVRAARSGTRGLPPRGLGGSGGKRGSMTSQNSSGTRSLAMLASTPLTQHRFC
ncbi:MAG: hypothetical protein KatS3mg042_0600 [Rhodothermaceae bacterium]|nr:MAG: hypothetical protein KatS3mg042_0600 [Rhodothermaceae bacterium]